MSWEAVTIGEEFSFEALLNGGLSHDMRSRLTRFKAKSAIDLGCGVGTSLLLLHYGLGIDVLEGVDNQMELMLRETAMEMLEKANMKPQDRSLESYWAEIKADPVDCRPQIVDRTLFRPLLNISFATTIECYAPKRSQYDFLIASQVLHYMAEDGLVGTLNLIRSHSHPGSMIYLSVKDGISFFRMDSKRMVDLCRAFAMEYGLSEYSRATETGEGTSFTFTNL